MKKFLLGFSLTALIVLSANTAYSAVRPFYQDIKLPSQAMIEHKSWAAPAAAAANNVLSANAGVTATSPVTVSSFLAQPDFPRNLQITPGGTTADVTACTVTISGTNAYGAAISEGFSISNTQSTATVGAKAFKTISSVLFPAACEGGATHAATWSIGFGSKLGLDRCVAQAGDYSWSVFNAAFETTRGTLVSNATVVESNTFAPNGTMDGVKNVDLYYVQNFRCFP